MMRVGPADNVWHSPSMSKPIQLCLKKASVIAPFLPRRTQSEVCWHRTRLQPQLLLRAASKHAEGASKKPQNCQSQLW